MPPCFMHALMYGIHENREVIHIGSNIDQLSARCPAVVFVTEHSCSLFIVSFFSLCMCVCVQLPGSFQDPYSLDSDGMSHSFSLSVSPSPSLPLSLPPSFFLSLSPLFLLPLPILLIKQGCIVLYCLLAVPSTSGSSSHAVHVPTSTAHKYKGHRVHHCSCCGEAYLDHNTLFIIIFRTGFFCP